MEGGGWGLLIWKQMGWMMEHGLLRHFISCRSHRRRRSCPAAPAPPPLCAGTPSRLSAPACPGRERLQSAGRARKHGSRFVEIIGATASELALVYKSRREEEHLRTALQGLAL